MVISCAEQMRVLPSVMMVDPNGQVLLKRVGPSGSAMSPMFMQVFSTYNDHSGHRRVAMETPSSLTSPTTWVKRTRSVLESRTFSPRAKSSSFESDLEMNMALTVFMLALLLD